MTHVRNGPSKEASRRCMKTLFTVTIAPPDDSCCGTAVGMGPLSSEAPLLIRVQELYTSPPQQNEKYYTLEPDMKFHEPLYTYTSNTKKRERDSERF